MLDRLSAADFEPLVGEPFELEPPGVEAFEVTLERCDEGPQASGEGRSPFSLIFRGRAQQHLGQGIWAVRHARIGPLELFVVQIGPTEYQVVFG